MAKGIDTPQNCQPKAADLKNAGYEFVIRYYNINNAHKNLTLTEAQAISHAGMQVVVVWENGYPTKPQYFSYSKGVYDGTAAYHYALHEIGQPPGSPIYFGVDYDAMIADLAGSIQDYFRGVKDGFSTISSGNSVHPVGIYGSGLVCSWLLAHGYAQYSWLAQSTGWSGYHNFTKWNIKQGPQATLFGLDVDPDESQGQYGAFTV